jgi:anti-sigma factor RsiW
MAFEPLTCGAAERLLRAHLDRELDPARAEPLEAHLASCPACRSALAATEAISRVIRGAAPAPGTCRPPVDLAAILIGGRRERSREERLVRALQRVAAAAALVIGASTVWIGWSFSGPADAQDGDDLLRAVAVSSSGAEAMIDDENSILMVLGGR